MSSPLPGPAERDNLRALLDIARHEDLGCGDITGELLGRTGQAVARFVPREPVVVSGLALLAEIAGAYDAGITTEVHLDEGEQAEASVTLATWRGPLAAVLASERVALNFLQRLCAVASATRRFVDRVEGTGAVIVDTRKTTPGWRALEKYAVRCGGGRNHRMGLYDAVLVKDNHLAILEALGQADPLSWLAPALGEARQRLGGGGFVEVEVDTLEQLAVALTLPVDVILLDNMTPEQLTRAVAMRDEANLRGQIALEASGGVDLTSVRDVAESGVERVAVGAITHSAPAVDIGLDVASCPGGSG
jgi:nicotinate-nucleotide pyrophosphorylase (carboxylating)